MCLSVQCRGAIRDYIARVGYASGVRFVGLVAGGICAACALTVSYDGFEKGSASGDASADGGSTGIGGGTFGGGTGGAAGGGGTLDGSATCANETECPADEPCVDWSCESGKCTPTLSSANECAPPECSDTATSRRFTCVTGTCTKVDEPCGPYLCQAGQCLEKCINSLDCVSGLVCNFTECQACQHCSAKYASPVSSLAFCEPDSGALWDALVQCCNDHCISECSTAAVCGGLGLPSSTCYACLTDGQKCSDAWNACSGDT